MRLFNNNNKNFNLIFYSRIRNIPKINEVLLLLSFASILALWDINSFTALIWP